MLYGIALVIVEWVRPRSDQAHVPQEDIPKLGQLVEAVLAKPSSHARNPRIILHFEERTVSLILVPKLCLLQVRVGDHGAQLIAAECLAFEADAIGNI